MISNKISLVFSLLYILYYLSYVVQCEDLLEFDRKQLSDDEWNKLQNILETDAVDLLRKRARFDNLMFAPSLGRRRRRAVRFKKRSNFDQYRFSPSLGKRRVKKWRYFGLGAKGDDSNSADGERRKKGDHFDRYRFSPTLGKRHGKHDNSDMFLFKKGKKYDSLLFSPTLGKRHSGHSGKNEYDWDKSDNVQEDHELHQKRHKTKHHQHI